MSYERFTERARKVIQLANQEASRFNHEYVGTEHLLLGLIKESNGVAANVLKSMGVELRKIRLEIEKLVRPGPDLVQMGRIPPTPRVKKVFEYALEEAEKLNHNYIGTEHILLGLLREQDGIAAQVLMNFGLKLDDVRNEILARLGKDDDESSSDETENSGSSGSSSEPGPNRGKSKTPALDSFGIDLTATAHQKKLDPVIGREVEIERAIQILGRRTKNNPVLLGEVQAGRLRLW